MAGPTQIHFMLLFSRHGKVRLAKWFTPYASKEASKLTREIVTTVLSRKTKMCNILEWQDLKIVYKRYGSCSVGAQTRAPGRR